MSTAPRIFISYARADGEEFADKLCKRLEDEKPPLSFWRDRYEIEGGKDWWNQVTDSLDQVQFAVLVMTPAAAGSQACRAEWRYARSQGVCVYPVKGASPEKLRIEDLPKWMSRANFYDLEKEWPKFIRHLEGDCVHERVPFMAPELPSGHVRRPKEFQELIDCVRDAAENPIIGTTVVHGAGGFGKTTLATALCHDDDILTTFSNGILWITLGDEPDIKGGLTKLYAALTGDRPAFVDTEDAATELRKRLADKNCLLVIDDVWDESHSRAVLQAGKGLSCLITTRNREIAAEAEHSLSVAEMTTDEAVTMLIGRLPTDPPELQPFRELGSRLGEWPLLLRLAAGTLAQRLQRGDSIEGALAYLEQGLDKRGFTVFDHRDPKERNQAVAATMAVSLDHLDDAEQARYFELSHFPDDLDIPFSAIGVLWGEERFETEALLDRLDDLSLLEMDLRTHTARLHDVIRAYIAQRLDETGQAFQPTFVVRSALADETLRYGQRRSDAVFELARSGKLHGADRTLALIETEPTWRQLALLTAAWLAAREDPVEACALRDRMAAEAVDPTVQLLLDRLQRLPDDSPPAAPELPDAPDAFTVDAILERLGGGGATALEPLALEGLADEAPAFLAERDGPFLVAYADQDKEHNTAPLTRYIAMLGSNEYEYYRHRSLAMLVWPVLRLTDAAWAQERMIDLCNAALSGQRMEYREPVAIAATARLAATGDAGAADELERLRKGTLDESEHLSAERGQGDPWARYLRRLATLAEAHARQLGADQKAQEMLDRALALSFGFAGFRAQACLTLAEAIRVCRPDDQAAVRLALEDALRAAHNIQEQSFCALSTARVHAMRRRWWDAEFDAAEVAQRLARTRDAPEFCPIHLAGEAYELREQGPTKLPNPKDWFSMQTLRDLSDVFRCHEEDLLRLNRSEGWDLDTPLPQGAAVNIPDPAFAPLLAARLAAEALATLPEAQLSETLRRLLQLARPDATAMSTVAARLLLADQSVTAEAIERLRAAKRIQDEWLADLSAHT